MLDVVEMGQNKKNLWCDGLLWPAKIGNYEIDVI
jgi:hypothetical protein